MSNFNETTPIDDWGAEHAPRLVENIDTHLAVLCDGLTDDQRYTARRLIMFSVREWAQTKTKEITNDARKYCEEAGEDPRDRADAPASTFIPED